MIDMQTRYSLMGMILCCVACACAADQSKTDPQVATILAIEADVAYGEYLSSECSTCHNESSSEKGIPTIHGKESSVFVQALLEYRDKKRSNETMRSIAGALGDEEIAALALYFSSE